jgi:phosphoglycerate dehydrogenase-like enzyme
MTMRVVTGGRLPEARLEEIRAAAGEAAEVVLAGSEGEALQEIPEAEVYLAGPFDARILEAARSLKWVHATGAGVEGMLFPEFVAREEVLFTNSRGAHHIAMPEYVLMAMLSWTHHLPALLRAQSHREWVKPVPEEIHGKTLGLLGYGEIGRATAARAAALGVRCIALRRNPQETAGSDAVERMYGPHELHSFLAVSDFVVNSLPLTAETRGRIGAAELRAMRPTAVLIHLGRGPTVNQDALFKALRTKTIAGAFLDVFDQEPLPSDSPFWELENAIITSHTSGNSVHYQERAIAIFCENLRRYRRGEPLRNMVDKRLGY